LDVRYTETPKFGAPC
jgi:hypothetical protein